MVLVATRPLASGTELFLNYRLNPNSENHPAWYHPCDVEEDESRWNHTRPAPVSLFLSRLRQGLKLKKDDD